jgi:hypothetical protein
MRMFRCAVAVVVVLALALTVNAADAAKKAAKGGVRGSIVAVDQDTKTVTVKVMTGKKGNVQTEEKKFKFTDATKVQTLVGKPKDNQVKDGTLADLAKDKMVQLVLKDDTIESVKVATAKKKK